MVVLAAAAAALVVLTRDDGPRTEQYGVAGDVKLKLDLYLPELEEGDRAPVLVVVHDGGWNEGSRRDWRSVAEHAQAQGWAVVVPDYRLSEPLVPSWPGAASDLQSALTWVADRSTSLALDLDRVALLGGSAGGQLVATLASVGVQGDPATATEAVGTPAIRAVATWSGPFELSGLASVAGSKPPACGTSMLCTQFWQLLPVVTQYLGCTPTECADAYRAASPVSRVHAGTAPMLIVNATDEPVPLAQARAMVEALEAAGVRHELLQVPGSEHSRGYADEVLDDTLAFLRTEVDRPRS